MAQLNIYVREKAAENLRAEAAKVGVSLSGYVAMLLDRQRDTWPEDYFARRCGFLKGEFAVPEDPLPEPVELG